MSKKIKIFGATPSPYTQKILAAFRYRHIPYMVYNGDIAKKITKLGIELPKPILLPTILLPNDDESLVATTDSTPIIRRWNKICNKNVLIPDIFLVI